jgi:hypothetical protein
MRLFVLFTLLFTGLHVRAITFGEKLEIGADYTVESNTYDSTLTEDQAIFTFILDANYLRMSNELVYSIGSKIDTIMLDESESFKIEVSPGKYDFQFYLTSDYTEISIKALEIKPAHRMGVRLIFGLNVQHHPVRKPVIYLYPTEEMDVEVHVNPTGKMVFTYPTIDDHWNVHALPSGELIVDDKSYNYLFWESEQVEINIDWNSGFAIPGEEVTAFLEETLSKFGLTTKEQADFITFWAPMMVSNPANLIHFEFNENCNQFADLTVLPSPDNVYRIYMIWSPIDNIDDFNYLRPQNIQSINRLGFTVLEWGGAKIERLPLKNKAL